jgi:hypothetical protein
VDFGLCVCACVRESLSCVTFVELRRDKYLELGVEKGREERGLFECIVQQLKGDALRIKEVGVVAIALISSASTN